MPNSTFPEICKKKTVCLSVMFKQVSIRTDDSICNPLGCEIVQSMVQHALEDGIGDTFVESVFYHPSHFNHYTQCNQAFLLQWLLENVFQ